MNRELKLKQAKSYIIMNKSFIANLLLRMPLVENAEVKTMATDGTCILYNPEYVDTCSKKELIYTLAHESFHPALLHHTRRGTRDVRRWNRAGDYVINLLLEDAGFDRPEWVLYDRRYKGMSTDKVYSLLLESGDNGHGQKNGWKETGEIGEVTDYKVGDDKSKRVPTTSEKGMEEQKWRTSIAQATQIAKKHGQLSSDMDRFVKEILNPRLDYRAILARFQTDAIKCDYSWRRPNRRYIGQDIYLPSLSEPSVGKGVLIMDTSGSVSNEQMNLVASESQGIVSAYHSDLDILYVDSAFKGHEEISWSDCPIELHPRGGGGTDFRPGFQYMEEQGIYPAYGIYLTDGHCNRFPKDPGFPFLWILIERNEKFSPPFGEVIVIDQ